MSDPFRFLPSARRDGIITKEVDGELLVYDRVRDEAHCLNQQAAAIWKLCDGRTTPLEIAQKLRQLISNETTDAILNEGINHDLVCLALTELDLRNLLEAPENIGSIPNKFRGMPRREAMRRIGLGAAIAIPIITSLTVPTAVQAAVSCKSSCSPCASGPCCSGVCGPPASVGCSGPSSVQKCL